MPHAVRDWVRSHVAIVAGAVVALVLLIVVVIAVAAGGGGGGGAALAPGSIVGTGALKSGYRITGKVVKTTESSIVVRITSLDFSAGEARNVVLRPGAQLEFDRPADGTVALARNGREIGSPLKLHGGDSIILVGEFTSVAGPSGAPHQGYSYLGVEATSK